MEDTIDQLAMGFKLTELVVSVLLGLFHVRTEFLIPSIGYGTPIEMIIMVTAFSTMVVPLAARVQGAILQKVPFDAWTEMFISAVGCIAYAAGGVVTISSWLTTQKLPTVYFRSSFNELFLAKGIIACFLSFVLLLDGVIAFRELKKH